MQDLTLVIMAAGMGSRFGGPKQITPVGPNGEFIMDYSIYDAKLAGFNNIVLIIRKEMEPIFKDTIEKRVKNDINISYAYQELDSWIEEGKIPGTRTKPLGTAHAILCAKDLIKGSFAVINADDFYGRDSYLKVANFLNNSNDIEENVVISYPYIATSSKYGSVKRGVIELEKDYVTEIIESKISTQENNALCEPLDQSPSFEAPLDVPVSMNFFGFKNNFLNLLEQDFQIFLNNDKETLEKSECLLPDTIKKNIKNNKIKLKNIESNGEWAGVTYKEDLPELQEKIKHLINSKEYPENLWN